MLIDVRQECSKSSGPSVCHQIRFTQKVSIIEGSWSYVWTQNVVSSNKAISLMSTESGVNFGSFEKTSMLACPLYVIKD